jgi:hypothetical protein
MNRIENNMAIAIHRYVEWTYPGETNKAIAQRGIAHFNCAVSLANSSLIAAIVTVAATALGYVHLVFGLALLSLASYVHLQTSKHLDRLHLFLTDLLVGFMRRLADAPQPNEMKKAKKMAQQMQPINLCSIASWYNYIHLANFGIDQTSKRNTL